MTTLASLLGTDLPLIQAPMAGVQDEALAIAVTAAGGLGSMPCAMLDSTQLEAALQTFATLPQPVNLNFFCHAMAEPDAGEARRWRDALTPYYAEYGIAPPAPSTAGARRPLDAATVDLLEAFQPRIVSFHFGLPDSALLARIKGWGAAVLSSATTLEEGVWLQRQGVDAVIAQGIEAGGHRGYFLSDDLGRQPGTRELVASLSKALTVPVIAAGGVGDRADVQALLAAGASAVQAGTAYLLCPEATTPAVHRAALQQPGRDAALTNLFSGRPARGLVNRLMRDLGPLSVLPPAFPWASQALAPLRGAAEALGRDDFSPLWAGSRPGTLAGRDAAQVTRRLMGVD
ncbi:2-nitropropane dioxygenase [Pseudoxanthomonas sp. Root65]|uniref:NAD(P)H-dependent flavin oxidoreductase n=1 Tax=Pseudoxanthomonas sp. Root65 TaxID=1736576 RepID=UPI0006FC2D4D|nr:nitronate monooxygenase [Pseudoxanthomonas sp. Root65]KRA51031.1 2-nitropropane dioxygenase [Pseudoxanthomonas sp. Root65]